MQEQKEPPVKVIRHEHVHVHLVKVVVEHKVPFWQRCELIELQERTVADQLVARWFYG